MRWDAVDIIMWGTLVVYSGDASCFTGRKEVNYIDILMNNPNLNFSTLDVIIKFELYNKYISYQKYVVSIIVCVILQVSIRPLLMYVDQHNGIPQ